jgi:Domain of unknown function (DUF4410)
MDRLRNRNCARKLTCAVALLAFAAFGTNAQSMTASDVNVHSVPVYVDDFELPALGENPGPAARSQSSAVPGKKLDTNTAPAGTLAAKSAAILLGTDSPNAQARRLVDFFNATLVGMLQKNSYNARRQQGSRPENGVMIRGVFAEVDPLNQVRKAILGSASTNTKYTVYVGIFNLARTGQPLYQLADVQSPDYRFGPVISLNNYIPMAKYELDKNPTEDDVGKICAQIVGSLTELLRANPTAFTK